MPKEKTNWKHIHKVRIHENRWLAWTIAIAVLLCAALVAYIQVTDIHFETQMSFSSGPNANWSTFNHRSAGYNLKYPKTWGLETESESSLSFINAQNPNEYFSVSTYPTSEERQIRTSLIISNELPVKIGGLSGTMVSQGRNQSESIALVRERDTLFVLRGTGSNFNRILATFRFNQRLE